MRGTGNKLIAIKKVFGFGSLHDIFHHVGKTSLIYL